MTQQVRKPRIAFMGEFSAGKSTLTNLLLGGRPLPEKVTATRLSPVWMSHGNETPYRVTLEGERQEISLARLDDIPLEDTRVVRMFFEADILGICDLIDFPGISDPNMSSEVWQRVLEEVDAVIWCTHATQAWRQSEAAVWEGMPDPVREKSILLITRFDKLVTVRDEDRVLARLRKEAAPQFGAMFPISLTDALAAGDDEEEFAASGGADLLVHLLSVIRDLSQTACLSQTTVYQSAMGLTPKTEADEPIAPIEEAAVEEEPAAPAPTVMPRRVKPSSEGRAARPRRSVEPIKVVNMPHTPAMAETPAPAPISAQDLKSVFQ